MGRYIQGPTTCKAEYLIDTYNATRITKPASFNDVPEGKALICVVVNAVFDAAAFCYNEAEFREFTRPDDPRPRHWLLMDFQTAVNAVE